MIPRYGITPVRDLIRTVRLSTAARQGMEEFIMDQTPLPDPQVEYSILSSDGTYRTVFVSVTSLRECETCGHVRPVLRSNRGEYGPMSTCYACSGPGYGDEGEFIGIHGL